VTCQWRRKHEFFLVERVEADCARLSFISE